MQWCGGNKDRALKEKVFSITISYEVVMGSKIVEMVQRNAIHIHNSLFIGQCTTFWFYDVLDVNLGIGKSYSD